MLVELDLAHAIQVPNLSNDDVYLFGFMGAAPTLSANQKHRTSYVRRKTAGSPNHKRNSRLPHKGRTPVNSRHLRIYLHFPRNMSEETAVRDVPTEPVRRRRRPAVWVIASPVMHNMLANTMPIQVLYTLSKEEGPVQSRYTLQ